MKDILTKFAEDKINTDNSINIPDGKVMEIKVNNGDTNLITNITNILNVVIGLLGIVCVIVIILGGVTYMTSSGDSTKVKKGKDTILYGVIGLIICILAAAIVNFVINNIAG